MKAILNFTLLVLPFAFAKEGDSCAFNGLKGTCQNVSKCTSGFTVNNLCPDDPIDVKCCLSKSCTSVKGDPGTCRNKGRSECSGTFVTGRCPGPNDVQCCVAGNNPPASPPAPRNDITVDFWINAFIPLDVAGVTKPYPKDTSKTMINGIPIIGDCFLTDQRGFSPASGASARMHSQVSVKVKPDEYTWWDDHHCGETVEVDCEDGDVEGRETQDNENMAFEELSGSPDRVVLGFKAARHNPLVTGSPDIDLVGTLTVDRVGRFVEFVGKVDEFPAFEAYASINGGPARAIDQLGPKPGAGPSSLVGPANRDFGGRLNF